MKSSSPARPRVVIFDLGKVLVDFDYSLAARRIAAQGTLPADAVQRFIDHSPLLFRFETGQITREEFFAEVKSAAGFSGSFDQFSKFFADIFAPIGPMVELHARLRAAAVPTFIFSNTNELAVGHIRKNFPFFSRFDGYILSYEHGTMKPHASLYEVVEHETGCRGGELFYVDDRPENLETASDRGWQVVLQKNPGATRRAMKAAGLPVWRDVPYHSV
ncbi:MAG TPA: HAD family phosphatase [Candidatus Angelobacter sp.]|nr:HAD family phosphatase [Candidatus Angelobacter sp.]